MDAVLSAIQSDPFGGLNVAGAGPRLIPQVIQRLHVYRPPVWTGQAPGAAKAFADVVAALRAAPEPWPPPRTVPYLLPVKRTTGGYRGPYGPDIVREVRARMNALLRGRDEPLPSDPEIIRQLTAPGPPGHPTAGGIELWGRLVAERSAAPAPMRGMVQLGDLMVETGPGRYSPTGWIRYPALSLRSEAWTDPLDALDAASLLDQLRLRGLWP